MSASDHSLYVHKDKEDITLVAMYADDLIIRGDTTGHIEELKMKDLEELHYFPGIKIICSANRV